MMFVITGTEAYPFDNLIREIDRLKGCGCIKDNVFIQLGSCNYVPEYCSYSRWLPFNEMIDNINTASLIISHAGAGTTLLCLELGKKPVLVTRKKEYGEHLDNHQILFAEMMENLGLAIVAYDVKDLEQCIGKNKIVTNGKQIYKKNNSKLINYLNSWIME
ncbi:MAG: glycosyltransferase [Spirochaetota bacterium]